MDLFLASWLQQIAERPDDDRPRMGYAARLDQTGRGAEADEIRRQLAAPAESVTVSGWAVDIGIATLATVRRGFAAAIRVPRHLLGAVGDAFREQPVQSVWVDDTVVAVAYEVPLADRGDDLQPARAARRWVATAGLAIPLPGGRRHMVVSATRVWVGRHDLIREIGAWAAANLPAGPPPEFCYPPR